jgi:hypothetical protein
MPEIVASYDVRGTLAYKRGNVYGWCYSPQRPAQALRVEILADGVVVASGIAARLTLELVRPGVTDGYHGYSLQLPSDTVTGALLEARESETRQVFSRRLPEQMADVATWGTRARSVAVTLAHMHKTLAHSAKPQEGLRVALAAGGAFLAPESRIKIRSGMALRCVAHPEWSIILDLPRTMPRHFAKGSAGEWALRAVSGFTPLLATTHAELITIDDGRAADALAAVRGLIYSRATEPNVELRLRHALQLVSGSRIALFAAVANASMAARAALLVEMKSDLPIVCANGAAVETGVLLLAPRHKLDEVSLSTLFS